MKDKAKQNTQWKQSQVVVAVQKLEIFDLLRLAPSVPPVNEALTDLNWGCALPLLEEFNVTVVRFLLN